MGNTGSRSAHSCAITKPTDRARNDMKLLNSFSLDAQPFDHITSALYLASAAMNLKDKTHDGEHCDFTVIE